MKRQCNVRREAVERPDAHDRWDRAYQSLLRWSLENERGHERARAPSANGKKEEYHEGGSLRTEEKLSKNRSFARRNNKTNEHLLRALVSCGECMLASIAVAKTFGKNNDRKQRYYVCSGKFNKAQSAPEEKCSSRYAPADQLEEIVWRDLCEVLIHPESITDALRRAHGGEWLPQELKARQENLRKGRSALGRQLERLTEAYLGEVIPLAEYQRRRQGLEQRDEALSTQAQTHQRMELAGVAASIEDFCQRVRGGLADAAFEQKRKLVELLIDRVIVTEEEVEIRYVIPTSPESEQVRFCHLRSDYLDRLPGREVVREQAPGTPATDDVEDGV